MAMKKVEPFLLRSKDLVGTSVDTFYRWKKQVGDRELEFALHGDPSQQSPRTLYISEVSTGASTRLSPLHPVTRKPLTEASFNKANKAYVPGAKIKHLARSILHRALATAGHESFLQAIDIATLKLMAAEGRKVLDNDPAAVMLSQLLEQAGSVVVPQSTGSKADALEELKAQRATLQEQWDVFSKTPDELDALDAQMAEIDAQIEQLEPVSKLEGLKLRLEALEEQASQHGTMTGDTTDSDYGDLTANIEQIKDEISELEKANGA